MDVVEGPEELAGALAVDPLGELVALAGCWDLVRLRLQLRWGPEELEALAVGGLNVLERRL